MSQAMQVQAPVARAVPAAGSVGGGAESPDSSQSFESALAGQLAPGKAPVRDSGTAESTAPAPAPDAPTDANAPMTAELAASGNPLLPVLPPDPIRISDLINDATENQPLDSTVPVALADVRLAAPAVPVPSLPPVVLPAREGQFFSPSAEAPSHRPAVTNIAARVSVADTQAALAADALAAETAAAPVKTADVAAPLDVFRAALKEIAPSAADARPVTISPQVAPGLLSASSFANLLASGQPVAPPTASATVAVPFGQAGWGQAFGNQVVWAVNQGMPAAQLHLSPPDLGPLSVRISLDQDQASINFSSAHALVRDAIEAALPRLRDMLGAQGITLADVNVATHGDSQHAQHGPDAGWRAQRDGDVQTGPTDIDVPQRIATGVLDVYV